jgi:hypothetical protein
VISGASGAEKYVEAFDGWRRTLVQSLRGDLRFDEANVIVLGESPETGAGPATRDGVRNALSSLGARVQPDDLLLLVLIGHGTADGSDAKFNLVGPDLEASEWESLLKPFDGRVVVVNTAGASFPFLERLSAAGRVVVTATDSTAQQFETIFPEFFVRAFGAAEADADKNERVSIWEAFVFASLRVRQWYEQRGQLATERALLDDNGDRVGKEANAPGPDGDVARRTFLDAGQGLLAPEGPVAELQKRRAELEAAIDELRTRKPLMPADEYERELEAILIELARVSRQLRARS